MIKELLAQALERRFVWRTIGFTELSELYVSSMMRVFALSILTVFVPFYLYQHGYSPAVIFAMYGIIFVARAVWDILAGYMVARFGPKHTLIASCIMQIISAGLFLSVPTYHWSIFVLGLPWGAAISLYFVAYHTALSKVKHTKHAGKELGIMQIMEKIGGVAGPIVGGVAGTLFGAQYIFLIATAILLASLWPLFQTSEPVRTKQVLNFSKLPLKKISHDLSSYVALGIENSLCINVWAFYVALFALSGTIYAQLGALSAIAALVSISAAYAVGRFIDTHNARGLLRGAAVINALLYALRPFATSFGSVMAINIANESVTTAYRSPYLKGMYAASDDLPGFRIVYISSMECIASIAKGTVFFLLAIMAMAMPLKNVMVIAFVIAGVASLLVMTENYKVLSSRSNIKV